jgi:hypothetical protein
MMGDGVGEVSIDTVSGATEFAAVEPPVTLY